MYVTAAHKLWATAVWAAAIDSAPGPAHFDEEVDSASLHAADPVIVGVLRAGEGDALNERSAKLARCGVV